MAKQRVHGDIQPGIKWGPFTMRIPFVHLRFSLPDMLQGFAVAGATGLALVPYFMALLGLSFEEAVVMAMIHSLLISFSWMFFYLIWSWKRAGSWPPKSALSPPSTPPP